MPFSALGAEVHIALKICHGNGDLEYHTVMHNWDYNLTTMKEGPEAERWMLERMILYDVQPGERIPLKLLRKHFDSLRIPDDHRWFLQLFL